MKRFHCRFLVELKAVRNAVRRKHLSWLIILSLALLVFQFSAAVAIAQTTTSTIEGTVTDANGAVIAGATVKASGTNLATERSATTDAQGSYRMTALPAGMYTVTVSQTGFTENTSNIELTLNRTVKLDIQLSVGGVGSVVNVTSDVPLLNTESPATGMTVTPRQIADLPVNGRDYLDLLQLVPGVAVNRQADPQGDNANPVLGERSGNNNFFIDGQTNKNAVSGGPAAQFNQETIAEFQVLTTGYNAEFGQASGAIINVITKSGGNGFHGVASLFHRNEAFDSSNSLDPTKTEAPLVRRFDYSAALGGPIIKDKMFFFGSAERIMENRQIDFTFPSFLNPTLNQLIHNLESSFDVPDRVRETRVFLKLNEQLGRHSISEEVNYTNGFTRKFGALFAGTALPSTRTDRGFRNLLLAFGDTMLLGDKGDPWVVTLRGAYRGEPSDLAPAHPETGGGSTLVPYELPVTAALQIPGPLGTATFGNNATPSALDQKYTTLTAIADKRFGNHEVKFGWNFLRTQVDGFESRVLQNQLYTTVPDFLAFDPAVAGIRLIAEQGGTTPKDDEIHLRNNYNALFVQDDWKILKNLTATFGVRWDYDSEFNAKKNFAPRLGVTWAITPKTVIRSQFGIFYDQFRLGTARDVPPFGGANQQLGQVLVFPRGLWGAPNFISSAALLLLGAGPCFSNAFLNNSTDAQIAGGACPVHPSQSLIGVDRLNNVVATGHAPIPANSVITINNIQTLSGLTPDQYLTQANTAIGFPGYFVWGSTGLLTNKIIPAAGAPDVLENIDKTPNTMAFSVGVQQEIGKDMVFEADYHHREIRNILGERITNLAFKARVSGRAFDAPGTQVIGFGPYYRGRYDALVLAFNKRLSNRFTFGANYTFAHETDNSRGVNLPPSDNFIGVVPVVTEASTGKTNANGSFTAANGNFVAQAGTFWNGPDVDKGPSDLSVNHIFQVNGLVNLPLKFQISGIFRAQSGFHFSRLFTAGFLDPDGDGNTNGVDVRNAVRNGFTAPAFVNLDMRFSKRFNIREKIKLDLFYEMFNVFNAKNPAAIQNNPGSTLIPFGQAQQVLPGREGQVGIRIEF